MGHASHRQVHTDLCAFALEIGPQVGHNILAGALRHAHNVLGGPAQVPALLGEFLLGSFALGAGFRGAVAFMDITANRTNKLFHGYFPPKNNNIVKSY